MRDDAERGSKKGLGVFLNGFFFLGDVSWRQYSHFTPTKKMAFVFPECHKPRHQSDCYHWFRESFADRPYLVSLAELRQMTSLDEAMQKHIREQDSQVAVESCGNPWNDFTDEQAARLKATQPATLQYPTNGTRPLVQTRVLQSEAEVATLLSDVLTGDCWSVFARDADAGLSVTRVFYFRSAAGACDMGVRESVTALLLLQFLKEHPAQQVCLSFGSAPFCDFYLGKLPGGDAHFLWTRVDCC